VKDFVFPQEKGNSVAMNGSILGPGQLVGGLTKREYFAAMILQGFAASSAAWEEFNKGEAVEEAISRADLLLKKLGEKPND
jgi:hypothetical protein